MREDGGRGGVGGVRGGVRWDGIGWDGWLDIGILAAYVLATMRG